VLLIHINEWLYQGQSINDFLHIWKYAFDTLVSCAKITRLFYPND